MMPVTRPPELLLPAGSLAHMRTAYDFGADAVYAGQPRYALRARHNEFDFAHIAQGIQEAHDRGKKFFLTSNLLAHHDRVKTYLDDLDPLVQVRPDGLTLADPGLITMVLNKMHSGAWPHIPIHLSVQANTTNHTAVKFWQKVGVRRIILSRELSLDEIEAIRNECPDIEIEVLVHGSLCIAYSGRCLLSGYFNRRDAEQGLTKDAHRSQAIDKEEMRAVPLGQDFDFAKEQQDAENAFAACGGVRRHPLADQVYLLEELERPGQLMPVMEDEHGTYIMNSKDLRAVEHIDRLVKMGVDALKIEGRTKSLYYVARTAQIYRCAINDAVAGRPFNPEWIAQLESLAHRGYTSGFLERRPSHHYQAYERGGAQAQHSQYVGQVRRVVEGWAEVELKDVLSVGDTLEMLHPSGNRLIQLNAMRDEQGQALALTLATAQTMKVWIFVGDQETHAHGALLAKLQ